jgi:hypothetical protein
MRAILVAFLLPSLCFAAPVTIRVLDGSGAPVKYTLVIVQSLDSAYRDVTRQLTDEHGGVSAGELKPGLYRVIATTPYGLWETTIKEFLVTNDSVNLTLVAQPQSTHGFGDIVTGGNPHVNLQVLMPDGTPAVGADVLLRDRDATLYLERRYKLDKHGKSKIELISSPTVLVIIFEGRLLTTQLAQTDTPTVIRFTPD